MADFVIKPFVKPEEVRRSWKKGSGLLRWHIPKPIYDQTTRTGKTPFSKQRLTQWPAKTKTVNYEFLERCKIVLCRIPHPSIVSSKMGSEYHVSILPWSRGSYLDIREYRNGRPNRRGLMVHLDVMKVMLPEIIQAVRQMELDDQREEAQKFHPEVIRA